MSNIISEWSDGDLTFVQVSREKYLIKNQIRAWGLLESPTSRLHYSYSEKELYVVTTTGLCRIYFGFGIKKLIPLPKGWHFEDLKISPCGKFLAMSRYLRGCSEGLFVYSVEDFTNPLFDKERIPPHYFWWEDRMLKYHRYTLWNVKLDKFIDDYTKEEERISWAWEDEIDCLVSGEWRPPYE